MFNKLAAVSLVLCSVSTMAMAESLSDVLAYTYENSLTVNAERTALKATDESVAKAKSGYRPTLIAQGSAGRSYYKAKYDNNYIGQGQRAYQDPHGIGISFVQPVFSGLTTVHSVEAAKQQVRSERANLMNTEQSTLLDAVSVYMDVIRDRAVLDLQINNEKVLQRHLDSYRKRFKAGELTRTDVAQSEARVSGAKANRIAAEGQVQVSKANYFSVIGLETPDKLDDVQDISVQVPKSLDEALMLALKNNPKIKAAEYAVESAQYTVKAQKGVLSPSVDITADAATEKEVDLTENRDTWTIKANLTIPLYQSGSEYADIRAARQTENQYRILLAKIKQDVRAETISAWENYQATKAQIQSIKDQIKASKIALDGVIREAQVGSRTVLDVLDAEQEHLDNQVSLVKTHRDEIVSAYSLLSAVGQMNPVGLNLKVASYDPKVYYEEIKNKWIGYGID